MMQENMGGKCETCGVGGHCGCFHHKIIPLSIIIIGILFLASAFNYVSPANLAIWWPIFLIVIGVMKLCGRGCKCCGPKKI